MPGRNKEGHPDVGRSKKDKYEQNDYDPFFEERQIAPPQPTFDVHDDAYRQENKECGPEEVEGRAGKIFPESCKVVIAGIPRHDGHIKTQEYAAHGQPSPVKTVKAQTAE